MPTSTHTPGPWVARQCFSGHWMISADSTADTVAHVPSDGDAHLIEAAPDMYVALLHAVDLLRAYGTATPPALIAAAIARAKGGAA